MEDVGDGLLHGEEFLGSQVRVGSGRSCEGLSIEGVAGGEGDEDEEEGKRFGGKHSFFFVCWEKESGGEGEGKLYRKKRKEERSGKREKKCLRKTQLGKETPQKREGGRKLNKSCWLLLLGPSHSPTGQKLTACQRDRITQPIKSRHVIFS